MILGTSKNEPSRLRRVGERDLGVENCGPSSSLRSGAKSGTACVMGSTPVVSSSWRSVM